MTLEPGITLGRYQILAPLGHGGMASVYKAFQPALERVVALKVLRPAYASDPEFLERFRREAKAIARLRHPHIVQVHDFEEASGQVYLVMEHIEGGTLKQRLSELGRQGQRLPPRELGRIVREVAEALGHAHAQGIVHRDIKPSNVMITRDGKAVVTDFGIAKILAAAGATQTGVGVGTPEYMSPEQGQASSAVDHRSDIYSLGVLAYELLVGRVPFSADTPLAVMLAHVRDPLPLPSTLEPTIGPRTEQVLLRALAKDPSARYGAATELASALDAALALEVERAEVPPTLARATPRLRAAALPALPRTLRLPAAALIAIGLLAAAGLGSGVGYVGGLIGASAPGASGTPIATAPLTPAPSPAPAAAATPRSTAPSSPATAPAQPTLAAATAAAAAPTPTLPPATATGAPAPAPTLPALTPIPTLPALTPIPTPTPFTGTFYVAKLDGTSGDVVGPSSQGDAAATVVRYLSGAIEIAFTRRTTDIGTGTSADFRLPSNAPAKYVGELDIVVAPNSEVAFAWLFNASSGGYHLNIETKAQHVDLTYYDGVARRSENLARLPISGLQTGRVVRLKFVVDTPRHALYVDGREVFSFTDDRVVRPRPGFFLGGPGPGTVRITGARYSTLP